MQSDYETPIEPISDKFYKRLKSCSDDNLKLFVTNFLGPIVPRSIRKKTAHDIVESGILKDRKTLGLQCCMSLQICKHGLVQNYKSGWLNAPIT